MIPPIICLVILRHYTQPVLKHPANTSITLTLAHSPDPDDVFMWWPLGSLTEDPVIDTGRFRFDPLPEDIAVLNRRAVEKADLDITAISIQTYPLVKDTYALTSCAGSFGEGYGPRIVARNDDDQGTIESLKRPGACIAVPGLTTTAFALTRMVLGDKFEPVEMPFDQIAGAVTGGQADAGVLIHDAQLTYGAQNLRMVLDLGQWWSSMTGTPLPLGGNVLKRDLDQRFGSGTISAVGNLLRQSIEHALEYWEEGKRRIAQRYPGLDDATLDQYLRMYVSELTVDCSGVGTSAIELLLERSHELGLCPDPHKVDLVRCNPVGSSSCRDV